MPEKPTDQPVITRRQATRRSQARRGIATRPSAPPTARTLRGPPRSSFFLRVKIAERTTRHDHQPDPHQPPTPNPARPNTIKTTGPPHKNQSPSRLAVDHLDRLTPRIEILQQPSIHLHLEPTRNRPFRLTIPHRRARPGPTTTNRTMMMLNRITAPLIGRNPIPGGRQHKILLPVLISPKRPALRTERTGAACHRRRPFGHGELGRAAMATSLYRHRLSP
jgi:hypothetical protein